MSSQRLYAIIYFYGGPVYANCTCNAAGRKTLPYYFIGWAVLLSYSLFYAYRKRVEDKRTTPAEANGRGGYARSDRGRV